MNDYYDIRTKMLKDYCQNPIYQTDALQYFFNQQQQMSANEIANFINRQAMKTINTYNPVPKNEQTQEIYEFKKSYKGNITADVVVCYGKIVGNIKAENVVILGDRDIIGNIKGDNIIINGEKNEST